MENNVNEVSYALLQNEYFKRKNIDVSKGNLNDLIKFFPEDWFLNYSLEDRINIISTALKNNIDLNDAIEIKKIKF